MIKLTKMAAKVDIEQIFSKLLNHYNVPVLELKYNNAFELLVAVILAAQTKDERVNKVTPKIFQHFKTPADFLKEGVHDELKKLISSINFYQKKANTIINCCKILVEKFNGQIPKDVDTLATFPGIGRKSAAMVIANAYNIPAIFVDTHVLRVSQRLGLAKSDKPDRVEEELKELLPQEKWKDFCLLLIMHGKKICTAKNPNCTLCPVNDLCNYYRTKLTS